MKLLPRIPNRHSLLTILALLGAGFWSSAHACSCVEPPPPREAVEDPEIGAVFHGRLAALRNEERRVIATFDVFTVWKGPVDQQIEITTSDNTAACGLLFERGVEYIVYAWAFGDELHANSCTRTRPHNAEEEEALGDPIAVIDSRPPLFVRGEINNDGAIDIADVVAGLVWFFTAGPDITCRKTLDVNSDGLTQISDPIYLVNFLFLGGPAPMAPFPDCGVDEDELSDEVPCVAETLCAS